MAIRPKHQLNATTNTGKINLKLRGISRASCAGSIEEAITAITAITIVPRVKSCSDRS